MTTIEKLHAQLVNTTDAYVLKLCEMWDIDHDYCEWVGNDCTGILCINEDLFLNWSDVVLCVEKELSYNMVYDWQTYCAQAAEYGFTTPNLNSWSLGCPRVSEETFERIKTLKKAIQDLCNTEKEKLKQK